MEIYLIGGLLTVVAAALLGFLFGLQWTRPSKARDGNAPGRPGPAQPRPAGATLNLLSWNPLYESGDILIDTEHRQLFQLSDWLISAHLRADCGGAEIAFRLSVLYDYAARHFSHEEEILDEAGYPGLREHAARHAELLGRIAGLRDSADRGEAGRCRCVSCLVLELIQGHVLGDDRAFNPLLDEDPVAPRPPEEGAAAAGGFPAGSHLFRA